MPPQLLRLPDVDAYRRHFIANYCRNRIVTHDNYRVIFRPDDFGHAFYESPRRDGIKDEFSPIRAERMEWIAATLSDPSSDRYKGWVRRIREPVPTRRAEILHENFVVVIRFRMTQDGTVLAYFVTCYQADESVGTIRSSPIWNERDCIDALR